MSEILNRYNVAKGRIMQMPPGTEPGRGHPTPAQIGFDPRNAHNTPTHQMMGSEQANGGQMQQTQQVQQIPTYPGGMTLPSAPTWANSQPAPMQALPHMHQSAMMQMQTPTC